MVHARVGALVSSHHNLEAHKSGNIVKGGATVRDELYQVERQSKKQRLASHKGSH